ncbi:MAG: DNA internalization-related competence protein ComEC/Rec2 [Lachnospiraceae bacterium]|nr:DNA internalization-related competence protein ComEC/Rec2 [Lachnospiraceae bacterium]
MCAFADIGANCQETGLHISLIGCALYSLLKKMRCPKAAAGCAAFVLLLLYGRMTGMGISIFRAITMFVLLILSEVIGRTYDLASSLALSCTIITITNPGIIRDSGFMLSFGAVLGIGLVKPFLDGYFPRRSRIGDALLISFSVNVFTLPIVLYSYYQLSTYSMVTNLVLIPLMSLVLPLAILSGLFGLILPGMGAVLACPCRLLLFFYEGACRINDELPGSLIVAGKPKLLSVFIYYGLLAFILIFFRKDSSKHQSAALPARKRLTRLCLMALLLSLGICLLTFRLRPELQAVMLDIGQGDCSILQTRSGRTVMIDCGSSDESQIAKYKVIPYLKSVGTDGIDYAVVTHADADHISGLEEMFAMEKHEGVKIRNLILPDIGNKDSAYLDLIKAAGQAGCRIQMIRTGGRLSLGGLQLECLHPDKGYTCEDRNEYSTVLSVTYGDFSALYTGDIQGRGEEILTKRIRHSYTLLKCAHHGSENSTPMEFLHRADPVYTFISAGRENRYGHPHEALLLRLRKAGTRVYVTSSQGAITLTTNGRRCFVHTFIKNGTDGSAVTSGAGQTATAGKRR